MKKTFFLLVMLFLLTGIVFSQTKTASYRDNFVTITYSTTEITNFVIVNNDRMLGSLGIEVIIVYQDESYSIETIWVNANSRNTSYVPRKIVRDVLIITVGK